MRLTGLLVSTLSLFASVASAAPELLVQTGHTSNVLSAAMLSGRDEVATGESEGWLIFWSLSTGRQVAKVSLGKGGVRALAPSPDGRLLAATVSSEEKVVLIDVATRRTVATTPSRILNTNGLAWSPKGDHLAFPDYGDVVVVRPDLKPVARFTATTQPVSSLSFSPDGAQLAVTLDGGSIWRADTKTWKAEKTWDGYGHRWRATAFSPDGRWLVWAGAAASGPTVHGFTLKGGGDHDLALEGEVQAVAFTPDSKTFVAATDRGKIRLFAGDLTNELGSIDAPAPVNALATSSDSRYVLASYGQYSGSTKLGALVIDVAARRVVRELRGVALPLSASALSPDGRQIALGPWAPSEEGSVRILDLSEYPALRVQSGAKKRVGALAFSPDGRRLAAAGEGELVVWDLVGGAKPFVDRAENATYMRDAITWSDPLPPSGRSFLLHPASDRLYSRRDDLLGIIARHVQSSVGDRRVSGGRRAARADVAAVFTWRRGDEERELGVELRSLDEDGALGKLAGGPQGASAVSDVALSADGALVAVLYDTPKGHQVWTWRRDGTPVTKLAERPSTGKCVALTRDGRKVAVATLGGDVEVSDAADGHLLWSGRHQTFVDAISFSNDGARVLSSSRDGTAKLWDATSGAELASIVVSANDFFVKTPDGYYLASRRGAQLAAFRVGDRVLGFDQFDLLYNRPDLVLERIGVSSKDVIAGYRAAYKRRLARVGFSESALAESARLPEAQIIGAPPTSTAEKVLKLAVRAEAGEAPLDRLNVLVNEVAIFGAAGSPLAGARTLERTLEVPLTEGRNKIQISVHDTRGLESLRETVEVSYTGPAPRPELYVVAIGVSKYEDKAFNLEYAAKDAQDLGKALAARGGEGQPFAAVHLTTLVDAKATAANIRAAKKELERSRPEDEAIVFFAGHGVLSDQLDYYLAPTEMSFGTPAKKGLPYAELERLLDGIPARRKILLIDACHSGEVDKEDVTVGAPAGTGGRALAAGVASRGIKASLKQRTSLGRRPTAELLAETFAELRRGTGAVVIASASGVQFALESDQWKNGVFTYALLEALRDKPAIAISELRDRVGARVGELTGGRQTPTTRRENLELDFRVF